MTRYPTLADWRALAIEALIPLRVVCAVEHDKLAPDILATCGELFERFNAVTDAEDLHPPTVHVCRTVLDRWFWNMREANGRIIATAGESFVDKSHAVAMARRIAGALGGRVIDDDTGEDITEPTTEVE